MNRITFFSSKKPNYTFWSRQMTSQKYPTGGGDASKVVGSSDATSIAPERISRRVPLMKKTPTSRKFYL